MATLALWITSFLTYFLVNNIATTDLWEPNDLMTALYVWAVVRVNMETWRLAEWQFPALQLYIQPQSQMSTRTDG